MKHRNISPGESTTEFTLGIPALTPVTLRGKRELRRVSDDSIMVRHRQNLLLGMIVDFL
jgi:hypothetical protein